MLDEINVYWKRETESATETGTSGDILLAQSSLYVYALIMICLQLFTVCNQFPVDWRFIFICLSPPAFLVLYFPVLGTLS